MGRLGSRESGGLEGNTPSGGSAWHTVGVNTRKRCPTRRPHRESECTATRDAGAARGSIGSIASSKRKQPNPPAPLFQLTAAIILQYPPPGSYLDRPAVAVCVPVRLPHRHRSALSRIVRRESPSDPPYCCATWPFIIHFVFK